MWRLQNASDRLSCRNFKLRCARNERLGADRKHKRRWRRAELLLKDRARSCALKRWKVEAARLQCTWRLRCKRERTCNEQHPCANDPGAARMHPCTESFKRWERRFGQHPACASACVCTSHVQRPTASRDASESGSPAASIASCALGMSYSTRRHVTRPRPALASSRSQSSHAARGSLSRG